MNDSVDSSDPTPAPEALASIAEPAPEKNTASIYETACLLVNGNFVDRGGTHLGLLDDW